MLSTAIDNRYQPLEALGEGAMGQVWLANDEINARQVALKVVSTKLGANDKSRLQFKQEFRLMTQLRHPNCCQVFDYGETADGAPYFTMEVVQGHGLDELIARAALLPGGGEAAGLPHRGLEEGTFLKVFAQLMLALGYVHGLGLVHGDLKSANVRVKPDGTVKLMDYGLMDYVGRAGGPIRGTPAYMAPEVIKRAPVDRRSDLYSVGCLAYELLTGVLPFGGTHETLSAMQLLKQHVNEMPQPLETHRASIAPDLAAVVLKLLAKDPLDRYQSAFEVLEALGLEVPVGIGGTLLVSPMIGRGPALAQLFKHLAQIVGGKAGGGVCLIGPAGIGKTRLIDEFRFAAQLEGVPCPGGDCFEQGSPPYGPFLSVLKTLAPAFREQLPPELYAVHAPVLVKLLPEIAAVGTPHEIVPAPDLENPKSEMMRMQTAIAHVLGALARKRPFAITFENWQWADTLSLDLLDYLLRNMGDAPLLVVATSREQPDPTRAIGAAPKVELGGLDGQHLRRMVTSMLGTTEVAANFLTKIAEFSEGNPFMVERLLEHLVQTQVLVNTRRRWNTDVALDDYILPLGLHAVLMRKVAALSASAQSIANIGAVIGRQFDFALIAELAAFPDERLFDALDQLQQAQILHQGEHGILTFVQDQVPELLYAHLDHAEKTRLHTSVAHALERRLVGPLKQAPLDQVVALARHALAGQLDVGRTLDYALEAGERNRRLFAMMAAERFIGAGLDRLGALEPGALRPVRLGLMVAMGEIKRMTGRAAEARQLLEPALALAEELGVKPLGRLLCSLGKTQQMTQDLDGALWAFERAVITCLSEDDDTGASRAYLAAARVQLFKGSPKAAFANAEEALALARLGGDPTQLGQAHALLGYLAVASAPDRLDEGVEHLRKSLSLLGDSGDQQGLSTSYQLLGNAQLVLGDLASARTSFAQNKRISIEINSREEEAFACINLGIVEVECANFEAGLVWAREARDKVQRLNARFPQGIAMVIEAEALAYLGQEAEARTLAADSLAISREIKHKYLESLVLGHQCELLAFLGRPDEARRAAQELEDLIAATGNVEPESRLNAQLSELLLRAGDRDAARLAAEKSLEAARAARAKGIEVRALKALARLAQAQQDFPKALERANEALDLSRRIGMRFLSAELLGMMGEASLALGDGLSGQHFDAMAALTQELGCPPLDAQARFGQAASRPYEGGAAKAAEAKAILEAWLDRMTAEGRASFPAYAERRRVLDGNYIGFSLPLRPRATGRGTQPLALPPGFRGTNDL
jgi:tetratricopeptide (TPR) repeat protein